MKDDRETNIPLPEISKPIECHDDTPEWESIPELKPGHYRFPDGSIRKLLPDGTCLACGGIVSKETFEYLMAKSVGMEPSLERIAPQKKLDNRDVARGLHKMLWKIKQSKGAVE